MENKLRDAFERAGQGHVFRWWDELGEAGRARLTKQLQSVNLEQVGKLAEMVRSGAIRQKLSGEPTMPEWIGPPRNPQEQRRRDEARLAGEALLRAGHVAALMVAGGQGTRLGYDSPKGEFPIGAVSGKSLFHIHAERIKATARRYGHALPWYIMTSDATDAPTREYFRANHFFGLPETDVAFFCQRMLPALDRNLRLAMTAKDTLLTSPNGHGGCLLALAECGMLDDMERRGVKQISYFQVDNAVVPAADPVFLGFHQLAGAGMSSKALWKREPEEPIGAFVHIGGPLTVVEYSDLSPEEMNRRDAEGRLVFGLGSIAIHAIAVEFVRKETAHGFRLPFHLAEKKAAILDEQGNLVKPQDKNIYKFEMFIFDALRDTESSVILEIRREEEFNPVKNATGKDSPESCRRDMTRLYAEWLTQAGVQVPVGPGGDPLHAIEISPLYALDAAELAAKAPRGLNLNAPLYLGPEGR